MNKTRASISTTQHSCFTRLATPARPHPRASQKDAHNGRQQAAASRIPLHDVKERRTEIREQILCTSTPPYLVPSRGPKRTSASHRRRFLCPLASVLRPAPGGADRDRTGDLLLAKQALSQLSYGPVPEDECFLSRLARSPSLALRRSSLRSRGPAEPKLQSSEGWWAWEDLNFRPHAYQARALTN